MTRAKFIVNMIGLYTCAAIIFATLLAIVASFTVVPMWNNYQDHGSIFLAPPPVPAPSAHETQPAKEAP
jgi:hypothetical protein